MSTLAEHAEQLRELRARGEDWKANLKLLAYTVFEAHADEILALFSQPAPFTPTHRHAEGGQYQVIGACKVHVARDIWTDGVRYKDAEGMEFVREKVDFDCRFTALLAPLALDKVPEGYWPAMQGAVGAAQVLPEQDRSNDPEAAA